MLSQCRSTVRVLMPISSPISRLCRPSARSLRTASSRSLRSVTPCSGWRDAISSRAVRPDWSTVAPPATARTASTSSLPGTVLLRYPAAPASRAPRTYSSSSYALTISTRQLIQDHPDVRVLMVSAYDEDEYVRAKLVDQGKCHLAGSRLTNDLQVGVHLEDLAGAVTVQRMVIDHDDADHVGIHGHHGQQATRPARRHRTVDWRRTPMRHEWNYSRY